MVARDTLDLPALELGLDREEAYFPRRVAGMMASCLVSIHPADAE